jgi:hypothetical protein
MRHFSQCLPAAVAYFVGRAKRLSLLSLIGLLLSSEGRLAGGVAHGQETSPSIAVTFSGESSFGIQLLSRDGEPIRVIEPTGPFAPFTRVQGLSFHVGQGDLYSIAEHSNSLWEGVWRYTKDGQYEKVAEALVEFGADIAVASDGRIAFSHSSTSSYGITLLAANGDLIGNIEPIGPFQNISRIQGLSYDPRSGDLYSVIDSHNPDWEGVWRYSIDGRYEQVARMSIINGADIAVSPFGTIAVSRSATDSFGITLLDLTGQVLGTIEPSGPFQNTTRIQGLSYHPTTGDLYSVVERSGLTQEGVWRYTRGGRYEKVADMFVGRGADIAVSEPNSLACGLVAFGVLLFSSRWASGRGCA